MTGGATPAPAAGRPGPRWRRAAAGLNAGTALALAAILFGMVNYFSFRHYGRMDWSRSRFYSLSPQTRQVLAGVTNPVDVVLFMAPDQALYTDTDNLLKEYAAACPWLRVERVDPHRDIARAEELGGRFKVERANVVVFGAGGSSRQVAASSMVEYDYEPVAYGRAPVKKAFRGEQVFTSIIEELTQQARPVVYWLAGHGERELSSFDKMSGYSRLAAKLAQDNIDCRELRLGQDQKVPDDAGALVIAGPKTAWSEPELELLRAYLGKRGRLLVLLDPLTNTGLDAVLAEWGLRLRKDVVVDATRTLTGRDLFITDYPDHPVTRPLQKLTSIFFLPRSIEPFESAASAGGLSPDQPRVTVLAACSDAGWAETDLDQSPAQYDPERDTPGPVGVAAAVEKGAAPALDMQIAPTRLVVFGDSDFVANGGLAGANEDLFMNALNWLLERQQRLALSAKPFVENRLVVTERQLRKLFWLIMVALPGLVAVVGGLVGLRRRA